MRGTRDTGAQLRYAAAGTFTCNQSTLYMDVLYKRAKTGAIVYWKITVDKSHIYKESGQLGTKKPIINTEFVRNGKNIGKSNQTTPAEQAQLNAESDWRAKHDEGYKSYAEVMVATTGGESFAYEKEIDQDTIKSDLENCLPEFNTDASGNVKPMLATDWKKIKKIKYPVLVQPKYDGVRCLAVVKLMDGFWRVQFLSRKGKPFNTLKHIEKDLLHYALTATPVLSTKGFILDGEIYSDELTFQEIGQAVKKFYPNSAKLKYRVYDVVSEGSQIERLNAAAVILDAMNSEHIVPVPVDEVTSAEMIKELHDSYVESGHEGAMLRFLDGKYGQGQRSRDLLKVKEFDEGEFQFMKWGKGERDEDLIAHLITKEGKPFKAKIVGNRVDKAALEASSVEQGVLMTIKHQGWTDDNIPRFPIGKGFRDYE